MMIKDSNFWSLFNEDSEEYRIEQERVELISQFRSNRRKAIAIKYRQDYPIIYTILKATNSNSGVNFCILNYSVCILHNSIIDKTLIRREINDTVIRLKKTISGFISKVSRLPNNHNLNSILYQTTNIECTVKGRGSKS